MKVKFENSKAINNGATLEGNKYYIQTLLINIIKEDIRCKYEDEDAFNKAFKQIFEELIFTGKTRYICDLGGSRIIEIEEP